MRVNSGNLALTVDAFRLPGGVRSSGRQKLLGLLYSNNGMGCVSRWEGKDSDVNGMFMVLTLGGVQPPCRICAWNGVAGYRDKGGV